MGSNFKKIISKLHNQHSESRLTTLEDIRKSVEWPNNRSNITLLRTRGYLQPLLDNLNSTRKTIIKVTLDIVSSCTMDKDFTREAMELRHNLLLSLEALFDFYPEEESMKERIFEILGNICKHSERWVELIFEEKPEFVALALELLTRFSTKKVPEATLMMVLRFLRLLVHDSPDETVMLVLEHDVMRFVSPFFIEVVLDQKNNEKVLQQTIELLYDYSKCDIYLYLSEALRGEPILYVCNRMSLFLKRIPRIMSNFLKFEPLESQPVRRNMCDWIIQKLKDLNIKDSKEEYVGYVCCLCFMLLDTCSEQHKQFLPELIKLLRFVENPSYGDMECFLLIIFTFNRYCSFSPSLAKCLLDCDVVQMMVEKLKWASGKKTFSFDFNHHMTESDHLDIFEPPYILGNCNHPNPRFNEEWNGEMYTTSELGWSCPCSDKDLPSYMKELLQKEIMSLFHTYACAQPSPELASEELIAALLNCSLQYGDTCLYDRACRTSHLVHLMRTTVIEKFYDMYHRKYQHNSKCVICKRIRDLGFESLAFLEKLTISEYRKEEVTEFLMSDRCEQKTELILSVPYLFSDKSRLAHIFLEYDYLPLVVQLLKGGSTLKERTIKVLHVLASQRLDIVDPTLKVIAKEAETGPTNTAAAEGRVVTFRLDDGSSVQSDRNLLTQKSWYFSVLLKGNFRECQEEEVALHNTPADLLTFMLHLFKHPEEIDHLVMEYDFDFLLDAIVFIDRHGQNDLRSLVMSRVVKYRMNSMTVAAIYRWSIESKLYLLRAETVTFALVHSAEDNERVAMFDSLLQVGYVDELIGDVQTILGGALKPYIRD